MHRQARFVAAIPLCTFLSLWLSSRTSAINHTVAVEIPYFSGSLHTTGACQIHLSASINTHASVQPQAASLPKLKALANPLRNRRGGRAVPPRNQNHCHPQHWRDCFRLVCEISYRSLEYSLPSAVVKNLSSNACAQLVSTKQMTAGCPCCPVSMFIAQAAIFDMSVSLMICF